MKLTKDNVQLVLGVYPERYFDVFPKVFELLDDPELDEIALYHYVVAFWDRLRKDERPSGHMGFDTFGQACFESGIVKAMINITQDNRMDQWHGLAAYFSMDAFVQLTRTGTSEERKKLLKELLDRDVFQICLEKIYHPLAIHRYGAVNLVRCLASENFLGEHLSVKQSSDMVVKLCRYILNGPEIYVQQFGDPELTWQTFLCFGKFGHPAEKGRTYAPRYYAMSQEVAAFAIHGLLLPATPEFCLKIVKHNPEILDLMFQCASISRPPWYPELQVDSVFSESLALFFRAPDSLIPGVVPKLEDDFWTEAVDAWNCTLNSAKILASRPKGIEMIFGVWETVESEKPQNVKKMLKQVKNQYFAQITPDKEVFLSTFDYRGLVRICMERLIATFTYATPEASLSDGQIFSLLRITHQGCRAVKTASQLDSKQDRYNFMESQVEVFHKPLHAIFTEENVEPRQHVASENVMGPIAHARLLTLLAQRGVLRKIHNMTELPTDVSTRLQLQQLKNITSDDAIRQFLLRARKRVKARKEEGNRKFNQDREAHHACFMYTAAVELAAALVEFDNATQNAYTADIAGVRKELVLCMGLAAEMAYFIKQPERATCLATSAVDIGSTLPKEDSPDALDLNLRARHIRMKGIARIGLLHLDSFFQS